MAEKLFYLTTIPGLESTAYLELCERWQLALAFFPKSIPRLPRVSRLKGGLEFEAPPELIFFIYPYLRVPQRLLLREKTFDADSEKKLMQELSAIPWSQYFKQGDPFDFKFSSRSSKLSMDRQIRECLQKALRPHDVKYQKGGTLIYVRLFRDQCTISLDATGEMAHKRLDQDEFKQKGGQASIASLRPNTAAGLLRLLLQGVRRPVCLIDPMCGGGTFLREAHQLQLPLERKFAFYQFPMYQKNRWLLDSAQAASGGEGQYLEQKLAIANPVHKLVGHDIHPKAIEVAQRGWPKDSAITITQSDLFDQSQGRIAADNDLDSIVIVNPPWGKRLPASSQNLLGFIYEKYQPKRIGLLMPAHWKVQNLPLQKVSDTPILNSGVENRFLVFA
jgi:putative N6-adenine-specific DNA methylase